MHFVSHGTKTDGGKKDLKDTDDKDEVEDGESWEWDNLEEDDGDTNGAEVPSELDGK